MVAFFKTLGANPFRIHFVMNSQNSQNFYTTLSGKNSQQHSGHDGKNCMKCDWKFVITQNFRLVKWDCMQQKAEEIDHTTL